MAIYGTSAKTPFVLTPSGSCQFSDFPKSWRNGTKKRGAALLEIRLLGITFGVDCRTMSKLSVKKQLSRVSLAAHAKQTKE